MRFAYLCAENDMIDGDHMRGWSPPYARIVSCICAYARLQSMMICHTNRKTELETRYNRVFILLHKPHDTALYVLFAACGEVSPLSA